MANQNKTDRLNLIGVYLDCRYTRSIYAVHGQWAKWLPLACTYIKNLQVGWFKDKLPIRRVDTQITGAIMSLF